MTGLIKNIYLVNDKTLGLTMAVEYNFIRDCWVAFFYQPAIICIDKKQHWQILS